jgi:hypothetical protein
MIQQADAAGGAGTDVTQQQQQMASLVGDAAGVGRLQMAGQTIAAAAAAAAERCRPVVVAMPDGGDVNFYELRPVKLMDMLANEY